MNHEAFVQAHLPSPPARVLEVGCGEGKLARALAASGHDVVAIDPVAPEGELFQAVSLEEFSDDGRPYLYGELTAVDAERERVLIGKGAIQAMGSRYVGELGRAPG